MNKTSTNKTVREQILEILEAVRMGGVYDVFPEERGQEYALDKDVALDQILTLINEQIIGEDEWVAEATLGMTAEQVEQFDKEVDTQGRIKRNQLRSTQRERLYGERQDVQ